MRVEILSLSLVPEGRVARDSSMARLFVEYALLDLPTEETPLSLPKPPRGASVNYNYSKGEAAPRYCGNVLGCWGREMFCGPSSQNHLSPSHSCSRGRGEQRREAAAAEGGAAGKEPSDGAVSPQMFPSNKAG